MCFSSSSLGCIFSLCQLCVHLRSIWVRFLATAAGLRFWKVKGFAGKMTVAAGAGAWDAWLKSGARITQTSAHGRAGLGEIRLKWDGARCGGLFPKKLKKKKKGKPNSPFPPLSTHSLWRPEPGFCAAKPGQWCVSEIPRFCPSRVCLCGDSGTGRPHAWILAVLDWICAAHWCTGLPKNPF